MAESFGHFSVFANDELLTFVEHAAGFYCVSFRRVITKDLLGVRLLQNGYSQLAILAQ